jgi:hypothetical protein
MLGINPDKLSLPRGFSMNAFRILVVDDHRQEIGGEALYESCIAVCVFAFCGVLVVLWSCQFLIPRRRLFKAGDAKGRKTLAAVTTQAFHSGGEGTGQ